MNPGARRPETFDAIVIGAGPAGSTCAYHLARAGRSALLIDRAAFPRDKPCGGGVTARAASLLPFSLDPVVEERVSEFQFSFDYGRRFARMSGQPLVFMTERARLDAFLAARGVEAGAVFRDSTTIDDVELRSDAVAVRSRTWSAKADALVVADGANGATARRLGIVCAQNHLVALEADVPSALVDRATYQRRLIAHVAALRGGYAWVFPKREHLNVGVVGWKSEGPRLRQHLHSVARSLDIDPGALEHVRGYRLPLRSPGDPLSKGRAILIGDAAGLIDPLSGEGIHSALLSAKLGAQAVIRLREGRARDLSSYSTDILSALGMFPAASWGGKAAFDRFPRASYAFLRSPQAWRAMERIFQGQSKGEERMRLPSLLARLSGDPGNAYLREMRAEMTHHEVTANG